MRLINIILLILPLSCTTPLYQYPGALPYISLFQKLTGRKINTSVYITDKIEEEVYALCIWDSSPRKIYLNRSWWNKLGSDDREAVILHELGHCELDREHVVSDIYYPDGCPLSLMDEYYAPGCYTAHREEYHYELVN